ncbi:uncharacterized protein LOC143296513 [Babylonia areolata]|uniref:uncharacterized protein LOC143296513 n=1 Tax=Babylonia areolata TaxID=304850 RepID=UPI003FD3C276
MVSTLTRRSLCLLLVTVVTAFVPDGGQWTRHRKSPFAAGYPKGHHHPLPHLPDGHSPDSLDQGPPVGARYPPIGPHFPPLPDDRPPQRPDDFFPPVPPSDRHSDHSAYSPHVPPPPWPVLLPPHPQTPDGHLPVPPGHLAEAERPFSRSSVPRPLLPAPDQVAALMRRTLRREGRKRSRIRELRNWGRRRNAAHADPLVPDVYAHSAGGGGGGRQKAAAAAAAAAADDDDDDDDLFVDRKLAASFLSKRPDPRLCPGGRGGPCSSRQRAGHHREHASHLHDSGDGGEKKFAGDSKDSEDSSDSNEKQFSSDLKDSEDQSDGNSSDSEDREGEDSPEDRSGSQEASAHSDTLAHSAVSDFPQDSEEDEGDNDDDDDDDEASAHSDTLAHSAVSDFPQDSEENEGDSDDDDDDDDRSLAANLKRKHWLNRLTHKKMNTLWTDSRKARRRQFHRFIERLRKRRDRRRQRRRHDRNSQHPMKDPNGLLPEPPRKGKVPKDVPFKKDSLKHPGLPGKRFPVRRVPSRHRSQHRRRSPQTRRFWWRRFLLHHARRFRPGLGRGKGQWKARKSSGRHPRQRHRVKPAPRRRGQVMSLPTAATPTTQVSLVKAKVNAKVPLSQSSASDLHNNVTESAVQQTGGQSTDHPETSGPPATTVTSPPRTSTDGDIATITTLPETSSVLPEEGELVAVQTVYVGSVEGRRVKTTRLDVFKPGNDSGAVRLHLTRHNSATAPLGRTKRNADDNDDDEDSEDEDDDVGDNQNSDVNDVDEDRGDHDDDDDNVGDDQNNDANDVEDDSDDDDDDDDDDDNDNVSRHLQRRNRRRRINRPWRKRNRMNMRRRQNRNRGDPSSPSSNRRVQRWRWQQLRRSQRRNENSTAADDNDDDDDGDVDDDDSDNDDDHEELDDNANRHTGFVNLGSSPTQGQLGRAQNRRRQRQQWRRRQRRMRRWRINQQRRRRNRAGQSRGRQQQSGARRTPRDDDHVRTHGSEVDGRAGHLESLVSLPGIHAISHNAYSITDNDNDNDNNANSGQGQQEEAEAYIPSPFINHRTAYDFLSTQARSRSRGQPRGADNEQQSEQWQFNHRMSESLCEVFDKHFVPTNLGGRCV